MVAEKEVRAFFHLHDPYQRVAVLERHAGLLMRGECAQDFPPTLVFAQLVGTDIREDHGGT